jgi:hypothetical protein
MWILAGSVVQVTFPATNYCIFNAQQNFEKTVRHFMTQNYCFMLCLYIAFKVTVSEPCVRVSCICPSVFVAFEIKLLNL